MFACVQIRGSIDFRLGGLIQAVRYSVRIAKKDRFASEARKRNVFIANFLRYRRRFSRAS